MTIRILRLPKSSSGVPGEVFVSPLQLTRLELESIGNKDKRFGTEEQKWLRRGEKIKHVVRNTLVGQLVSRNILFKYL